VRERVSASELHAYVDNCLSEPARRGFEARLREDEDLRKLVESWRAQNLAIRAAFGTSAAAHAPSASRQALRVEKLRAALTETPEAERATARTRRSGQVRAPSLASRGVRLAVLATLVVAFVLLAPGAMLSSSLAALGDSGAAAYRAFSASPAASFDTRAVTAADLVRKLGPMYQSRGLEERLARPGWTLRGARRAPGVLGEAVFLVADSGVFGPVGILVEPLDAPPASAPVYGRHGSFVTASVTRDGFGFAFVGASEAAVAAWLDP
jgi:hypothetical protein